MADLAERIEGFLDEGRYPRGRVGEWFSRGPSVLETADPDRQTFEEFVDQEWRRAEGQFEKGKVREALKKILDAETRERFRDMVGDRDRRGKERMDRIREWAGLQRMEPA